MDEYNYDITPVICKQYPGAQLIDWLKAANSDDFIRDLTITSMSHPEPSQGSRPLESSARLSPSVASYSSANKTLSQMTSKKVLAQRLMDLSGKHHPPSCTYIQSATHNEDLEKQITKSARAAPSKRIRSQKLAFRFSMEKDSSSKKQWHSDITFKPVPSDYALPRLTQLPRKGGGKSNYTLVSYPSLTLSQTLWVSGYELFDRLPEPVQRLSDGLAATYAQPGFNQAAVEKGFIIHEGSRGAPKNVGADLQAVCQVVRTNSVTEWKSLFAVGHHVQQINCLTTGLSQWRRWFCQQAIV